MKFAQCLKSFADKLYCAHRNIKAQNFFTPCECLDLANKLILLLLAFIICCRSFLIGSKFYDISILNLYMINDHIPSNWSYFVFAFLCLVFVFCSQFFMYFCQELQCAMSGCEKVAPSQVILLQLMAKSWKIWNISL